MLTHDVFEGHGRVNDGRRSAGRRRAKEPADPARIEGQSSDRGTTGTALGLQALEPSQCILRHGEPLTARGPARLDPDPGHPEPKRFREQLEERAICRAVDRRGGHPDLQHAFADTGHCVARRSRDEPDREVGPAVTFVDR